MSRRNSLRDLNQSLRMKPNDHNVLVEKQLVLQLMEGYRTKSISMSQIMLNVSDIDHETPSTPNSNSTSSESHTYERKNSIFNEFLVSSPWSAHLVHALCLILTMCSIASRAHSSCNVARVSCHHISSQAMILLLLILCILLCVFFILYTVIYCV